MGITSRQNCLSRTSELFGRAQDLCSRRRLGRVPLHGRRIGLGYPRHVDFIKGIVNDCSTSSMASLVSASFTASLRASRENDERSTGQSILLKIWLIGSLLIFCLGQSTVPTPTVTIMPSTVGSSGSRKPRSITTWQVPNRSSQVTTNKLPSKS